MSTESNEKVLKAVEKLTGGRSDKWWGCFADRRIILLIVFIAFLLDYMLLTCVVPVVPKVLLKYRSEDLSRSIRSELSTDELCEKLQIVDKITPKESVELASKKSTEEIANEIQRLMNIQYKSNNITINECIQKTAEVIRTIMQNELRNEDLKIGVMFASKAIVQTIVNPFVGPLTNRIGYSIPMFTGFVVTFISTVVFAFGGNYVVLFIARALQGVGSSFSTVSGFGMLATCYIDEQERDHAFSIALTGLALGVLIGPPFGGVTYQFIGKPAPFLILAGLTLIDGLLQLLSLKPVVRQEDEKGTITIGNLGTAMLEPSLPLWMWNTMKSSEWQQGIVFLPCSFSYLVGTNLFGYIAHKIGRPLCAAMGMVACAASLTAIPFCTRLGHLIVPMAVLGFSIGMIDSTMFPTMGYLVDLRHVAVYGSVYAIGDVALCLAFGLGPIASGAIVKGVGFSWMLWTISIASVAFCPLIFLLRNPPAKKKSETNETESTSGPVGIGEYGRYE
ncbi:unnamed protein product [Heterobilharzia americana]|nr:unnamed protein product [Heterobilharzia americana]CAH8544024.1 unnamed protein product [Heterobilharzia americana]